MATNWLQTLKNLLGLTTFNQETAGPTNANGLTWVDLLDKSAGGPSPITKPTKIRSFAVTEAGGWAGAAQVRIVNGAGTKIYPFGAQLQRGVDYADGTLAILDELVGVTVASGYKLQFRSTVAGDGVGKTLTLNELNVIEVG